MDHESIFNGPTRKRGRPAGKDRVPLSLQEKRARNAQYERERRTEYSEAMTALATAAGVNPGLSNAEILATVVNYIQNIKMIDSSDDVQALKRINQKLILQIQTLEQRLDSGATSSSSQESDAEDCFKANEFNSGRIGRKKIKLPQEIKSENPSPIYEPYEVPSPVTAEPSLEYFRAATQSYYTSSQSGTESDYSTEAHQAPWPEVEVLLEENTYGTMDCLTQRSIEDLISEYL